MKDLQDTRQVSQSGEVEACYLGEAVDAQSFNGGFNPSFVVLSCRNPGEVTHNGVITPPQHTPKQSSIFQRQNIFHGHECGISPYVGALIHHSNTFTDRTAMRKNYSDLRKLPQEGDSPA